MLKKIAIIILCLTLLPGAAAFAQAPKVLYDANITTLFSSSITNVYAKPDKGSKTLDSMKPGQSIRIVEVLPNYVGILLSNGKVGYVLRHRIENPVAVDPVKTPRFGTAVNRYYATVSQDTPVMSAPGGEGETLITLHEGAQIGFLDIEDGWASTIFKRQYGFVDTRRLPALEPVAPAAEAGTQDIPIAVYNSFYTIVDTEANNNRIINLKVCSERMSVTLNPGEALDFNNDVGPFWRSNGYLPAGALADGEWTMAYGGGSCQVSSTLYNVVLQLMGLTVLRRAPHSANGISYLPHGVDASSGALNFVFRNDYAFPVSIRAHVQDGSLFIAIYKGAPI